MHIVYMLTFRHSYTEKVFFKNVLLGYSLVRLRKINSLRLVWMWWCMPLILALKRHRQIGFYEFKVSLVNIGNFRPANAT